MTQRSSEVLQSVADDMAADAKAFDGQPFNGRTVAEYFGNQGAAIAAIATIVKGLVNEESTGTLGKAEKEILALRAELNELKKRVTTMAERLGFAGEQSQHLSSCRWEQSDCSWKATHHYCPHPEHACNCKEIKAARVAYEQDRP